MKLTVLGKYGPFPAPGGACSGYLLETAGMKLVIELGSGTLTRLLQLVPDLKIDGVVLSHLHSDHMSDMLVLRYALAQYKARGMDAPMPLTVMAPDEPNAEFRQLSSSGVFAMNAITDGMHATLGSIKMEFFRGVHTVPSYGVSIKSEGKHFYYTGDTGSGPDISQYAKNADMLLADTCYLKKDKSTANAPHLTAFEAGSIAKKAGVKALLCSHIYAGYSDAQILSEVSKEYEHAQVATEMSAYTI